MTADDRLQDRMVKLARQLLRLTLAEEVSWGETDEENNFLYSGPNSSVSIYHSNRASGIEGRYVLTVFNSRGTKIEELRSGYVPGAGGNISIPANWNDVLSSLYLAARRGALDVEGVLDTLITELSHDIEPDPLDEETTQ